MVESGIMTLFVSWEPVETLRQDQRARQIIHDHVTDLISDLQAAGFDPQITSGLITGD